MGLWSYNPNEVRGGFDANGNSLVFNPKNYDPGAASKVLLLTAFNFAVTAGPAMCFANGARELAKSQVFAARTAPELKEILQWGNGADGVQKARAALDAAAMARIQSTMSRAEIETVRNLYREATAAGRGGPVAPQRASYMEEILKLWR